MNLPFDERTTLWLMWRMASGTVWRPSQKARSDAWTLVMRSAAGTPLPDTSAIAKHRRPPSTVK